MQRRDPRPELRLSDADRERAIDRLADHYAAGRLDKDEFDERSDAVWTARIRADLDPIFADLGSAGPDGRRAGGVPGRLRWRTPVPFLPVLLVLVALTVLTHVPFVLLALVGCFWVFGRHRRWGA